MMSFDDYQALFNADKMQDLAESGRGLLWLKLKSISRKAILEKFSAFASLAPQGRCAREQLFKSLFDLLSGDIGGAHALLNQFIKGNAASHSQKELEGIASELHKMQAFSWGGDYTNALDKFLVDKYVKQIRSFDSIAQRLQTEIPRAVEGYVLCSWYNHWSTILIEHIFRMHNKVLPAIGKVKKVDFFIDDIPFDLKTTYLPANYVDDRRKQEGRSSELSELKRMAKEFGIQFDQRGRSKDVAYEIAERIKVGGCSASQQRLSSLSDFRKKLLHECVRDPESLIRNLYEKQGEMRFDASNRLFVVLADESDFDNSWKLKRNPGLLKKSIHAYLDDFSKEQVRRVDFTHKAKNGKFSALSDAICIVTDGGGQ